MIRNVTKKPFVKWIVLVGIAAVLLQWVDPSFVSSPYNGF